MWRMKTTQEPENVYELQAYITASSPPASWSAAILRNVLKLFLFTCVRFNHGGALQLQEDYGCTLGKGENQTRILLTVSVYKLLMKVVAVSGLCRHRSFENSTQNSDRNSSVSCLFDSAVDTLRFTRRENLCDCNYQGNFMIVLYDRYLRNCHLITLLFRYVDTKNKLILKVNYI